MDLLVETAWCQERLGADAVAQLCWVTAPAPDTGPSAWGLPFLPPPLRPVQVQTDAQHNVKGGRMDGQEDRCLGKSKL